MSDGRASTPGVGVTLYFKARLVSPSVSMQFPNPQQLLQLVVYESVLPFPTLTATVTELKPPRRSTYCHQTHNMQYLDSLYIFEYIQPCCICQDDDPFSHLRLQFGRQKQGPDFPVGVSLLLTSNDHLKKLINGEKACPERKNSH
jgi:hypothetical protein